MSDDPIDPGTEPLVARLADAFEHELAPVPDHLRAAARDAFAWRLADVRLAELLFDSATDELVGVRGTPTDRRSFRFGADGFVVRVHLTPATLLVMIEPPLSVGCRVATQSATTDHRTDELGELAVDAPELPVRVEVDLPTGTIATPFIIG